MNKKENSSSKIELGEIEDEVFKMINPRTSKTKSALPDEEKDVQPDEEEEYNDTGTAIQNGVFGNKGKLTSAVGIHDIKSIILEVIVLTDTPNLTMTRKILAIMTIILDTVLLLFVLGAFLFLKRDLNEKNDEKRNEKFDRKSKRWNLFIVVLSLVIALTQVMPSIIDTINSQDPCSYSIKVVSLNVSNSNVQSDMIG
jgi:hypothetical protein